MHQIVCVYLTEWHHEAAAKKAIYKMILEALRAQCNDESFPSTDRELYERRYEKQFLNLCSAETIERVVKARELGLSYGIFDKYEFIIKAAATLWEIDEWETKDKTCDKMAQLDSMLKYSHKESLIDMQKFLESAKEEYSNGLTWKNWGENLSPDSVMNEKKKANKDF